MRNIKSSWKFVIWLLALTLLNICLSAQSIDPDRSTSLPPTTSLTESDIAAIQSQEYEVEVREIDGETYFVLDVPTGVRLVKVLEYLEYKTRLQAWMEKEWSRTIDQKLKLEDKMYSAAIEMDGLYDQIYELSAINSGMADDVISKVRIRFLGRLWKATKKVLSHIAVGVYGYGLGSAFPI